MSDLNNLVLITLDKLDLYDTLIKKHFSDKISDVDSGSLKSIIADVSTHKIHFYKTLNPVPNVTTPDYTIDLSGYDDAIDEINRTLIDNAVFLGEIPRAINEEGKYLPIADSIVELVELRHSQAMNSSSGVESKVDTLVGNDSGKSTRTIVSEELAVQLLSGKANADFKTLQELAAWLEDHPEEVSEINVKLQNMQSTIGSIPVDEENNPVATDVVKYVQNLISATESNLGDRIQAVEESLGDGGSIDDRIQSALQDMDYSYSGDGDIVVNVSQTDGVISVTKAKLVFATEEQINSMFSDTEDETN